jgi:hypothetical protein
MSVSLLRVTVVVHRWLGIVFGLLFLAWFASGIVMMYARMPELPAGEIARRAKALDLAAIRVSPADVAAEVEGTVNRVQLTMFRTRPVYRLETDGAGSGRAIGAGSGRALRACNVIFADDAQLLPTVDAETSLAVVRELFPEHASAMRYDTPLVDADQWTMGQRTQMPLHRIAAGDSEDTYFYVAACTGDVVMRTTASERRWAYPGAVLHWLYFMPFRRNAALWNQSIIWLSGLGCVMCVAGLVWGVSVARKSPYSGLMKWHHYAGLIFGAAALTWVFSGLLSMGPFLGNGSQPTRAQRERVAGGPLDVSALTTESLRATAAALAAKAGHGGLKEIQSQQFQGELYLLGGGHIASVVHAERGAYERFAPDVIERAARDAMPGIAVEDETWLTAYDNYYYARDADLSLPVLRVRFADPDRTWLYLDARRGVIARREDRRSRIERWLYHGLHSFDFPFLYARRPLWDVVMIVLSVGGMVLSATTLLPGWRRLRRHSGVLLRRFT